VADLKKDYFLLCKKENLARTHSAKNNRKLLDVEAASRNMSHVNSPTSPCQWSLGFNRLDSVFDRDAKSVSDATSSADDDCKEVSNDCNNVDDNSNITATAAVVTLIHSCNKRL